MRRLMLGWMVLGGVIGSAAPCRAQAQTPVDTPGGNDSAYTALRVMGKTLGKDAMSRVVEVTGRDGTPQPYLWKIVLQEPGGGTREVDVAGGKIAAQHTDPRPPASRSVVHLQDLNLDSSGAFEATDAQARKVHLRFDSVNYALRTDDSTGKLQWTLNLLNQEGGDVGAMRYGANDGNIISIDGRLADGPSTAAAPRTAPTSPVVHESETTTRPRVTERTTTVSRPPRVESRTTTTTTTVAEPPPPPPPSTVSTTTTVEDVPEDRGEGGLFTRTGRTLDKTNHAVVQTLDKTNHAVEQTLRRAGAKVQRFFTGRSELDQDETPRVPEDNRD